MTQGAEFRNAQAQILKNRTACWLCKNLFDRRKGEMVVALLRVLVGKVGTQEQEITAFNFDKVEDTRKPVFEVQAKFLCVFCENNHGTTLSKVNLTAEGEYYSERLPSDLLWDEA